MKGPILASRICSKSWNVPYDHYIALVGKIVRVAGVLRDEPDGLSLQDLALRTGYVKSSVHRILQSLKRHGYIEQDGSGGKYRLGMQFLSRGGFPGGPRFRLASPRVRKHLGWIAEGAFLPRLRGRHSLISCRCLSPAFREARCHGLRASTSRGVHADRGYQPTYFSFQGRLI